MKYMFYNANVFNQYLNNWNVNNYLSQVIYTLIFHIFAFGINLIIGYMESTGAAIYSLINFHQTSNLMQLFEHAPGI